MQELQIFNNEEFGRIRTIVIDNEPYFVGKDVASALGYGDGNEKSKSLSNAVANHVDAEDKGVTDIVTPGGVQKMVVINESGVYALVFGSKLPDAKRFKHWITSEVLPALRKTGSYEIPKKKVKSEAQRPSLPAVTSAAKFLNSLTEKAGCDNKVQLLTVKSFYEANGYPVMIEIEADKHYVDTVHIARHVGLYYQSSGKPADKAVNEIIRRLDLPESMYTETWESKGNWQGAVRKYDEAVIVMVRQWYCENGYPRNIEYTQCDGQKKCYHVIWHDADVA